MTIDVQAESNIMKYHFTRKNSDAELNAHKKCFCLANIAIKCIFFKLLSKAARTDSFNGQSYGSHQLMSSFSIKYYGVFAPWY